MVEGGDDDDETAAAEEGEVGGAAELAEEGRLVVDELRLVFFREPPPTGMFLRAPPLVQYLLQFLQKWRG